MFEYENAIRGFVGGSLKPRRGDIYKPKAQALGYSGLQTPRI